MNTFKRLTAKPYLTGLLLLILLSLPLVAFAQESDADSIFFFRARIIDRGINQSVQFVGPDALSVLEDIRRHTKPGGWNVIGMFTRDEFDWRRDKDIYCLDQRELKHIYKGWDIFEYSESIVWSPRRNGYLSFANLIARKPTETESD